MMKLLDHDPTPFPGARAIPKALAAARPRRRRLLALAALPLVLATGVGVTRLRGEPAPQPPTASSVEAPAAVKTVRPLRQTIRKTIEQPGRVEGYEQTPIHVKIPGFVVVWNADIGQRVAEGEVLTELSVPEEREELKRREAAVGLARAEVTAAETALEAAKADEARAGALVAQAKAANTRAESNVTRWTAEFKRVKDTHARGSASQSDYDITLDQLRTAEAAVKETEAGIDAATAAKASATAARVKAEAEVTVAKARLDVAAADARRQAEWLGYATVKAPFSGVVVQRNVDRGQYVTPPASGSAQAPLFVVVRTDPVRVFVDVPETEAALVVEKMPVTVRVQAQGDREIAGTVTRFSWALDANTRTLRVQIDLPNPDGLLRPGMFATARFVTERPGAWVVPAGAVSTAEEQPFAVRVEGGKGVKTPVKLGARQNGMVELLHKQTRPVARGEPVAWEPLTGAEEFLTARPAGWTDGTPVTLTR
jgi:multidrug efflux pump subunit AcrA (membrane-fusion protein)